MKWFKIHHGFTSNRKFGLVADQLDIPRAEVIAIALDLLDYASRQNDRGSLVGYDIEEAAYTLNLAESIMRNALLALRNRRFCNEHKILNWDEYQGTSDSTNAERQKRFRERKKLDISNTVTGVTDSNALRNTDKIRRDKIRRDKIRGDKKDAPALPDFLPSAKWEAFRQHRNKLRKPMTEHAEGLIIAKLEAFKKRGYDPVSILDRSITSGWQDVFEPKSDAKPKQARSNAITLGGKDV